MLLSINSQFRTGNNFWGNDSDANDSWETEDEISELGGLSPQKVSKPHLAAHLERARVAMARLEELFIINPQLQSQEIMKKLLMVYKKCRYLDRLMGTSFFHEEHFMGLVERVRKVGNQTTAERAQDHKNRLFNQTPSKLSTIEANGNKTPLKRTKTNDSQKSESISIDEQSSLLPPKKLSLQVQRYNLSTSSDISSIDELKIDNDSGHYSNRTDATNNSNSDLDNININDDLNNTSSVFSISSEIETDNSVAECVSARLCRLIKAQLIKALQALDCVYECDETSVKDNNGLSDEDQLNSVHDLLQSVLDNFSGLQNNYDEINDRYSNTDPFKEIIEEIDMNPPPFNCEASTPSKAEDVKEANESIEDCSSAIEAQALIPEPECFQMLDRAPSTHKFHLTVFHTTNAQSFFKAVQKETKLLRSSLPPGVLVRTFEDRLDLLSVMIEGPKNTPYEDGLFLFDIQLGHDYPRSPPLCHYISYCSDRLNPNLYEDGKVCVSLLGTWSGRGTEMWGSNSTLLQVIVSIQGLILVAEPYYNEAGYEKQRGTQQGMENSRMYNEMAILKLVQSMTKLISNPPVIFKEQICLHFKVRGEAMYTRIKNWMDLSNKTHGNVDETTASTMENAPEFPLIPASRGFCLTLAGLLESFRAKVNALNQ